MIQKDCNIAGVLLLSLGALLACGDNTRDLQNTGQNICDFTTPSSGSSSGGDHTSMDLAAGGDAAPLLAASPNWKDDIHPLLQRSCNPCHAMEGAITPHTGTGPGRFAESNTESTYQEISKYLRPGDAVCSKLFSKLSEAKPRAGGQRMPPLVSPLPQNELDAIRRWIEAGAPKND